MTHSEEEYMALLREREGLRGQVEAILMRLDFQNKEVLRLRTALSRPRDELRNRIEIALSEQLKHFAAQYSDAVANQAAMDPGRGEL